MATKRTRRRAATRTDGGQRKRFLEHPIYVAMLGIGGLVAGVVGAVFAATGPLVGTSDGGSPASQSAKVTTSPQSLAVASVWPFVTGCGGYGKVAMPPGRGRIEDFHATTDISATFVDSGAGSWQHGVLYLTLSTVGTKPVEILNIQPHIGRRDLAAPAWVYIPDDGCGPYDSDRVFNFDLDTPRFIDKGLVVGEAGQPPTTEMPRVPLGTSFNVSTGQNALIRVNASSCQGNYEWSLDVQYVVTGSEQVEHKAVGPFESYGIGNNTNVYYGAQDPTGTVQVHRTEKLTGASPDKYHRADDPFFYC